MSLFRPRKPSNPGARLAIWEMLFNGKFPFQNDSNGKWSYGPNGYRYTPIFSYSSGGGKTTGGAYIGEIDLTGGTSYKPQQWGRISAGSNMGTYICIQATDALSNPPQLPDTGNQFWNCVSNSQAQWM